MPLIGTGCYFDAVLERKAIRELLLAVPAPDNAIDAYFFRELQFDPALASFVGDPTVAIADFAVVDVFDPVNVRVGEYARSGGFSPCAGQSDISRIWLGGINLKVIETPLHIASSG